MRALITGASSGLGLEFARELSNLGYDLILVARSKEKLNKIKKEFTTNVEIIDMDLSIEKNVFSLYERSKGKIELLINNAGYGIFGSFEKINLNDELNLIDLNIKCVHILTKLFLTEFKKSNSGRILNVASSAGLMTGGPLLSSYYASKSYVCSYTFALYEELKKSNSNVKISVLCPGPINTNFNNRAGVTFSLKSVNSNYVAKYALKKMFKNKLIIIPGLKIKLGLFCTKLIPKKLVLKITYRLQKKKDNK